MITSCYSTSSLRPHRCCLLPSSLITFAAALWFANNVDYGTSISSFTVGMSKHACPPPKKCPFPRKDPDLYLTHGFFDPCESTSKGTSIGLSIFVGLIVMTKRHMHDIPCHFKTSVAAGRIKLMLRCGLMKLLAMMSNAAMRADKTDDNVVEIRAKLRVDSRSVQITGVHEWLSVPAPHLRATPSRWAHQEERRQSCTHKSVQVRRLYIFHIWNYRSWKFSVSGDFFCTSVYYSCLCCLFCGPPVA